MCLQDELYFIVEEEHVTYAFTKKRKRYRLTWEELIRLVETTPWSNQMSTYGGKLHHDWKVKLLKNFSSILKNYDPIEEVKWRNRPQLTDKNIDVLILIRDAKTNWLKKLVNKIYGY